MISLIVYAVLYVLSAFLLSVPGDYWPWFLVMGFVALVPLILGPLKYSLLGALALTFSSILILADLNAGRHHQEQLHRIMNAHPHKS